jgi:hypothetical protein
MQAITTRHNGRANASYPCPGIVGTADLSYVTEVATP